MERGLEDFMLIERALGDSCPGIKPVKARGWLTSISNRGFRKQGFLIPCTTPSLIT